MKITFLGTGTSQGVPFIGCDCAVCTSPDKRDNRLRTSVWVEVDGISIVIDSGPDFRYQMLRAGVRKLDAIIYTHGHKDHVAGLDDVRAFNFHTGSAVDIFANDHTQEILRREFKYVFESQGYPGVPQLNVHTITHEPFDVFGVKITPVRVLHYTLEVYGFRIGDFTYITDANYIAPEEMKKLKGSKALVLNALRHQEHISHYTLEQAIAVAGEVKAEHSYFTHISHQLGLHAEIDAHLPAGMHLAYDGLVLNL